MDPQLRKLGASSMADIDRHFANHNPGTFQIDIDKSTRLVDAVAIFHRMQRGVKGEDRIQVFNPERVLRKVEAEEAMRAAVGEMETSIGQVNHYIEQTREKINRLESLIDLGAGNVAVGPSINRRAMDEDQVIFPSHFNMEKGDGYERRMSKKQKLISRKADAESQMDFWKVNLAALQEKEVALVQFRDALIASKDQFSYRTLKLPTRIGCGYSDYSFEY